MTPGQRAARLAQDWSASKGSVIDLERLAVLAITAAAEAEREACLKIVRGWDVGDRYAIPGGFGAALLAGEIAEAIRARVNVSKSGAEIDTSGERVQNLTKNGHVAPWNDCPTCPACNWPTGTPIGTGQLDRIDWSGNPSLRCPRCAHTWQGTCQEIVQAQDAWDAWTIESDRQKREGR